MLTESRVNHSLTVTLTRKLFRWSDWPLHCSGRAGSPYMMFQYKWLFTNCVVVNKTIYIFKKILALTELWSRDCQNNAHDKTARYHLTKQRIRESARWRLYYNEQWRRYADKKLTQLTLGYVRWLSGTLGDKITISAMRDCFPITPRQTAQMSYSLVVMWLQFEWPSVSRWWENIASGASTIVTHREITEVLLQHVMLSRVSVVKQTMIGWVHTLGGRCPPPVTLRI